MITADGYRAAEIIKNISLLDPSKRFIPGKTLLFFDEMLGFNYKQIESNSVGYKIDWEMASMDFEEFLWAKGYGEDFICDMLDHMKKWYRLEKYSEVCTVLSYGFLHLEGGACGCSPVYREGNVRRISGNAAPAYRGL